MGEAFLRRDSGLVPWRRRLHGESYKQVVKLTFFRGASLKDPKKLFNSSLEGTTRRAIDIREGEKLNEAAFKGLIRSAVAANSEARARRVSPKK